MNERITIATLPENPNATQNSPTINVGENDVLKVADYSPKSFVVFGEATKTYKSQLRDLGGKFNGKLSEKPGFPGGAAWIFYTKNKPGVYDFVNKVNNHEINHHEGVAHQDDEGGLNIPTVVAPISNAKYQYIKWKVFKPVAGMKVTIKAGGAAAVGEVIQTESHRDIVDTAYINLNGNTSKLVICNGHWMVWGYTVDHTVLFSEMEIVKPDPKKDYNYEDIAGI